MAIERHDLCRMTEDVCEAMLGLDTECKDVLPPFVSELVATVDITGTMNGALEVAACASAARCISAAMFDVDPSQTTDEEIRDAIFEVANIIGGNIKGELGGECELSLPFVGRTEKDAITSEIDVAYHVGEGVLHVLYKDLNTTEPIKTN